MSYETKQTDDKGIAGHPSGFQLLISTVFNSLNNWALERALQVLGNFCEERALSSTAPSWGAGKSGSLLLAN